MNDRDAKDDPSKAPESGDAQTSGRLRGKVTEPTDDHDAADRSERKTGSEPDSGRQDATPRAGR